MTEDFRTMKRNDAIYDLAVKLCDFYAGYDPYSFFETTDKFETTEEDVEQMVKKLQKTRGCIGIEERLLEILTGDDATEEEEKQAKTLVREVYALRLSMYGRAYSL